MITDENNYEKLSSDKIGNDIPKQKSATVWPFYLGIGTVVVGFLNALEVSSFIEKMKEMMNGVQSILDLIFLSADVAVNNEEYERIADSAVHSFFISTFCILVSAVASIWLLRKSSIEKWKPIAVLAADILILWIIFAH